MCSHQQLSREFCEGILGRPETATRVGKSLFIVSVAGNQRLTDLSPWPVFGQDKPLPEKLMAQGTVFR
jgi:hypothetical protein